MLANKGSITAGTPVTATLLDGMDHDIRSITLTAGRDYTFTVNGVDWNGYMGVHDTTLGLFDAQGVQLDFNDDSNGSLNSQINFTPAATGTYFLEVQSYANAYNGGYTLSATGTEPLNHAPMFTDANQATLLAAHQGQPYVISEDTLLQGFSDEDGDVLHVTGLTASSGTLTDNQNGTWSITPATTTTVALTYVVTDGRDGGALPDNHNQFTVAAPAAAAVSVLRVDDGHTTEAGGTAHYSVSINVAPANGNVVSIVFTSNDVLEGKVSTGTVAPAATSTLTFNAANWQTPQILTITGQQDYIPDGNQSFTVTGVASQTVPTTEMTTAIRNFSGTSSNGSNRLTLFNDADLTMGGEDRDASVYLVGDEGRPQMDHLWGVDGADRLYGGYMMDELHGGIGNDREYGSYEDDTLFGEAGDDQLYGEQDDDFLNGGAGNDRMDGGIGADTMTGGVGSDTYYVTLGDDGQVEDTIIETLTDAGTDTIYVPFSVENYVAPTGIETVRMNAGFGDSAVTGNASNNQLFGNAGNNREDGGVGNDSLSGGAGNDNLSGGVGVDTLLGGVGHDSLAGGAGADLFRFDNTVAANTDTVTDFTVVDDTVQLQFSTFGAVLGTTVTTDEFFIGTGAHDASDHIIYNSTTGALSFDANGNTAGCVSIIGTLQVGLALTFADFALYI